MEDIARIEVTRSPNAATYGSNSATAIINVITRRIDEVEQLRIKSFYGALDTKDLYLSYSNYLSNAKFRISLETEKDEGFDKTGTQQGTESECKCASSDSSANNEPRRDGMEINRATLKTTLDIDEDNTVSASIGAYNGTQEIQFIQTVQQTFPDIEFEDYFINATWKNTALKKHEFSLNTYGTYINRQQAWRTCLPTIMFSDELRALFLANPDYVNQLLTGVTPSGGSEQDDLLALAALGKMVELGPRALADTCGIADQNYKESRFSIEFQDIIMVNEAFRLVSALGYTHDQGESDTYLAGSVSNNTEYFMTNAEYRYGDLVFNTGVMFEHDDLSGLQKSPRFAVNYHATPVLTLRFVLSKAMRTPDIWEEYSDWNYRVNHVEPNYEGETSRLFYSSAVAPGNLEPEEVLERSVGFMLNVPSQNLIFDLKVFNDKLTHLISEKIQFVDFNPTNNNSARNRGAEFELHYRPWPRFYSNFSYAYLDTETENPLEVTLSSRHIGNAWISYDWNKRYRSTVAYYGAQDLGGTHYDRLDLMLSKSFVESAYTIDVSLAIKHYFEKEYRYFLDSDVNQSNVYSKSTHYFLGLELTY